MGKRRKFSDEYKREAVVLANQPGVTKAQVGRELGVNANLLTRWGRELRDSGTKAFSGAGHPRDEEMVALKRELARVKKERDFLKETAVDSIGECNIIRLTRIKGDVASGSNGTTS